VDSVKINRVLISVSDKSGISGFAAFLAQSGCEIISTGGTRKELEAAGLRVTEISEVTGNPEAFGGRMKTISFQIESALLFDREKDDVEAAALGIAPIDMVICNLYPFESVKQKGADFNTLIENIDIGGPTMIRAAAKNFKYVAVLTDPADYPALQAEMSGSSGCLSYNTRIRLMRKAFNRTADYDAAIASAFDETAGQLSLRLSFDRAQSLRYGENSHQQAFFLRRRNAAHSFADLEILGGKEVSYNNLVDLYSALEAVKDLEDSACAIIKHNNPCGLASGSDQKILFEKAWAGDPVSAFGSVIAFNREVGAETTRFLELAHENKSLRKFVEVIAAPSFSDKALSELRQNSNLRIIRFDPALLRRQENEIKILFGSALLQSVDDRLYEKIEYVSEARVTVPEKLLSFGLNAVRQIKSNAIAIVRETDDGYLQMLGMGSGQPNRVNSVQLALSRARANLELNFSGPAGIKEDWIREELGKTLLVSDAFFPFADNIELAHQSGIRLIQEPGGSIRDKSVIEKCNEYGITLIFTGTRHFKH